LKDGRLLIQRMPRLQNQIDLLLVEPKSGKVDVLLSETAPQWVDGQGAIKVLDNGKYLWTSDRDGYNHIYLFDLSRPRSAGLQVTSGAWDLTDVSGVDQAHQVVYYVAARPDATQRQL